MRKSHPIPETVYDAALRIITRDEREDDHGILERWYAVATLLNKKELALEAMRQASENGIARVCK